MTIANDGNVGIGNGVSPSYQVDIQDTGSSGTQLRVETTSDSPAGIRLESGNGGSSQIYFGDQSDNDVGRIIYNHASDYLAFNVNASERMRIDSSGNVGINVDPNRHGYQSGARVLTIKGNTTDDFGVLELLSPNTTSSNRLGEVRFGNMDGHATAVIATAGIRATRDGADDATALSLWTGGSGSMSERLSIASNGNVGIGIAPTNTKLTIGGLGGLTNGGGNPTMHYRTSDGKVVYNSSSQRYKNNIRNIETDTSKIYEIECKTYESNDIGEEEEIRTDFGFIAEEMVELFPSVVCLDKENRPDAINYQMLVVPVIAELQKLKEKVTALENAS